MKTLNAFCKPLTAHEFGKPLHHFNLKIKGHPATERYDFDGVRVTTDFAMTKKNGSAYSAELIKFVADVEADWARRRAAPRTLGALFLR